MTTDERLEKLVERHEALTQSVELIAAMQKTTEKEQAKTGKQIRSLARLVEAYRDRPRSQVDRARR